MGDAVRITSSFLSSWHALYNIGTQVDWVYERFSSMQMLGYRFAERQIPWIVESNGPYYLEATSDRHSLALRSLAFAMERAALQKCDIVVCISETLKEILTERFSVSAEKIIIMRNAVDPNRFRPIYSRPDPISDQITVGYVGSLYAFQGVDFLLDALASLRKDNHTINLIIVGDGPELDALKRKAQSLELMNQVLFVGMVPWNETRTWIQTFDIGFSGQVPMRTGLMYGSPQKIYEYMAMGKPVLASRYEDARSLIEGHDTGFLFEPANRQSLREALVQSAVNRQRLPIMGKQARLLIERQHTWPARVKKLIDEVSVRLANRPVYRGP